MLHKIVAYFSKDNESHEVNLERNMEFWWSKSFFRPTFNFLWSPWQSGLVFLVRQLSCQWLKGKSCSSELLVPPQLFSFLSDPRGTHILSAVIIPPFGDAGVTLMSTEVGCNVVSPGLFNISSEIAEPKSIIRWIYSYC